MDKIPYRRCEALPQGRTFPAVCCRELQKTNLIWIYMLRFKTDGL